MRNWVVVWGGNWKKWYFSAMNLLQRKKQQCSPAGGGRWQEEVGNDAFFLKFTQSLVFLRR